MLDSMWGEIPVPNKNKLGLRKDISSYQPDVHNFLDGFQQCCGGSGAFLTPGSGMEK
jgi:hypothetical protein